MSAHQESHTHKINYKSSRDGLSSPDILALSHRMTQELRFNRPHQEKNNEYLEQ